MMKSNFTFKGLLLAAAMMLGGASSAWADDVTRTWDFTTGSWSTIDASTGTVYYATDGTAKTSTEYDASTAVCMQVTSEFTYDSSKKYYQVAGVSGGISVTDNVPNKNYMSVKIPAGYTLKVTAQLSYSGTGYSNAMLLRVGSTYEYSYSKNDEQTLIYSNSSDNAVAAYIYTPGTQSGRYIRFKKIILTNTEKIETLTAISGNTSWVFTNKAYSTVYDGMVLNNIYLGSGVKQSSDYLHFIGTGNTSTGAYTVQFKIPANKTLGLLVNAIGTNSRKTYLKDESNKTLAEINTENSAKDVFINITSSDYYTDQTLYFYNSNKSGGVNYIYVYTQQSVSIGSTGWATLYTPCALDFSGVSGLTAYTATCESSTVTLTKVNNVPAGTGIILKGTPNKDYDIPAAGSSSTAKGHLTGAFFTATSYDAYTDPAYTIYALTSENGGATVQFNPITSGEIAAGKAFLKISGGASALARSLSVVFADDETTGIADVRSKMEDVSGFFDLQGRYVAQPTRGIYVKNGKKVIVK